MAVNLSSSSPDGAQFMTSIPNGHRSMDRSSSFRDGHEAGRTHGGGGGGGGNAPGPACDLVSLSQLLSLDCIPFGEQRNARQTELRRVTNAITGSVEDPTLARPLDSLGAEELKRVKTGVSELSARARERSRHLSEAILKLDRYRQSRKRSKPDTGSERVPGASPADRISTTLKVNTVAGQADGIKTTEKSKVVPNKRLRTSIAGEGPRPNSNLSMKKSADRESPRSSTVLPSPTPTESRVPNDGWEKIKLKGRRSGIKSDANIPPAGNGVVDGERDHKWSGQHRLAHEARPRSNDAHGLRSGPVHGVTSIHKTESSMQMNGTGARGVIEGAIGDKADRSFVTDKERFQKNGVKPILQDDMHMTPGTSTVTKKAARAPRSGSMASAHLSNLNRVTAFSEKPQGPGKAQIPSGQGNRKRPAPSRSSSPVAQWVGQRPQKMARVARRVNLPPGGVLPAEDIPEALPEREPSAAAAGPRLTNSVNGVGGVPRRVPPGNVHSPAQSKPRSERMQSSVVVSESEESEEASENKMKDKGKKHGEWDSRPVSNHKSNLILPAKASLVKEDVGDGVRRQGRSGRNFCMPKPMVTTIEKVDVATSTAKQLRSARIEKHDRPGRTPTTKKAAVDRKSMSRIRRPISSSAPELGSLLISPGESDDDHEELVAAVRAAVDASAAACSSDFWKEMEPYFTFLTSDDISYLHQLADSKCSSDVSSLPMNDGAQKSSHFANGNLEPDGSDRLEVRTGGRTGAGGGWYDRIYPLSQRLLAALINEGEEETEKSLEGDGYPASSTLRDQKYATDGNYCSNGHGNNQSSFDEVADGDEIMADASDANHLPGVKTEGRSSTWDSQYEQLNLDDRILFELQSIGLVVEQVPDLSQRDEDEICVEISKLKEELKEQATQNRQRVDWLEKCIIAKREEEIRERERLAISKLVENAYTRRKGCRGSSGGAGNKGAGNKGTRAAALASAKRAMARLRKFEAGHSCFVDPNLRDTLLCNVQKSSDTAAAANSVDTSGTPAASETSLQKLGGKLVMRRTDAKDKGAMDGNAEHVKGKDNSWSSWKDSPEDLTTGATSVRNSHGSVGFGGAKGKRSERERDGKGQGKESHRKAENDRVPRQGLGTVKGERKTKTKPRQKTALFKDVNGLGKPAEVPKEKLVSSSATAMHKLGSHGVNTVASQSGLDLTQLAIPEDLGVHDEAQDIGAGIEQWFSSLEDTTLQDQGEFLMGLDVPMDDLSDLGMMM
ncbi:uncharacterized protein LOC9631626 isoform X1 [Selaginella moellendorffii]|uniref:uncharacterized protein LOC9631626 isoform X1 n=1 Tax=Selaginella moellendorffii TaxID=88036 RepID=UPI000D1C6FEC|nr:uncharacterized protein LOC9631626 isoform X1 [Selaginella moellendorffii]XP_024529068.1 uncharacterized protein LOC9631626 isoform X1 [Selaginella moellendorffii]|eukprot:XP_024529067.1 uncharacterized protein LOC9631626 isoform X1 [Selaginella moellendorffii]